MTPIRENHRRQSERGFTLVEILLAMGISGMLFTMMFLTLDQVVRSRNDMSNLATPYVIGPAILDVMSKDLANVYFYDVLENNSFYGADAQLYGREADALSFITLSKSFAPDQDLEAEDEYGENRGRYAYVNEVGFALKRQQGNPNFLELWRREDFYVDEAPHAGGEYVLMYDRVHSLSFQYISRNPDSPESGPGGQTQKDAEDMLQDGWVSLDEGGVPRAILVILEIYARDSEEEVEERFGDKDNPPRIYRFTRYLTLPQVHMSRASEEQIANWDGEFNEATAQASSNPNARGGNAVGGGGARGRGGAKPGRGGAKPGRGGRGGGRGNAASNPFLQALQGRGGGGGGGGGGGLSGLFGGGR